MVYIRKRFDPAIHHRQSIRLKGHDYCRGWYFITIRTQDYILLFGEIKNGVMKLNEFGQIVRNEWLKTPLIRPYVRLDEFVVMPDHFHGIIGIGDRKSSIGKSSGSPGIIVPANRPNGPEPGSVGAVIGQFKSITTKQIKRMAGVYDMTTDGGDNDDGTTDGGDPDVRATRRVAPACTTPAPLPIMIGHRIWQRDYYDCIIRDAGSLERIRRYIIRNPENYRSPISI